MGCLQPAPDDDAAADVAERYLTMRGSAVRTTHSRRTRGIALAGATAIVLGGAVTAVAQEDDTTHGSITVYKYELPDESLAPQNGQAIDDIADALTAVAGAGFSVCEVEDIDLMRAEDWETLKKFTVAVNTDGTPAVTMDATEFDCDLVSGQDEATTDGTGKAVFVGLPAYKAYVVYESELPSGALYRAAPTFLTIPYPGTGTGEAAAWNYNPVIYPKNVIVGSGATKEASVAGDTVSFDITVPINALGKDKAYTKFVISDQLGDHLAYTGASFTLTDKDGYVVDFVDDDYTLTAPSGVGGAEVVLALVENGLSVVSQNIGGKLVLTITTKVLASGSTENMATITINEKSTDDNSSPKVVDEVDIHVGAYLLKKGMAKDNSTEFPLAGAVFAVYEMGDEGCADQEPADGTEIVKGLTSGSTGETDTFTIPAGYYCVYETSTPFGYKNAGVKEWPVKKIADLNEGSPFLKIVNEQIDVSDGDLPALPVTGASGIITMLVLGGSLISLGVVLAVVRRRRDQASS
ncbi:isopeptide-forming domain-containing fimbrial protein [Xylanimonas allomyrinae]|uniref:Isopeptide-forming domain-containing fimbrial protein n=1 Tax=Xylanimonas allomyrinae TaxID=2509459 RepID=A0A4P6EVH4_9MICO|nr:SpaH/EbpB family LPXTG-anchored major pilin [Xylanimonas allomyrinae]QAY62038.1 isopeptide-forming domain-containing fimbrial protein [Xylanimonas allomyrinae]